MEATVQPRASPRKRSHAMHMEPQYCFTIPSLCDDLTLDCRVYHGGGGLGNAGRKRSRGGGGGNADRGVGGLGVGEREGEELEMEGVKGVIIAHPYAPMGGCYDDRVVGILVQEFLALGWVVGTFNFRGAHGSKGRTSWTGRPELEDYVSFATFFAHYLYLLEPHPTTSDPTSPQPASPSAPEKQLPISLILGGYSYGSLITKHLPPLSNILTTFRTQASIEGSAASEILLRARRLAAEWNAEVKQLKHMQEQEREQRERHKGKGRTTSLGSPLGSPHAKCLSVTIGGEETSPEKRRRSAELHGRMSVDGGHKESGMRRSLDGVARGFRSLSLHKQHHHRDKPTHDSGGVPGLEVTTTPDDPQGPGDGGDAPPEEDLSNTIPLPTITPSYLLISPLTAPLSTLAAPALGNKFWHSPSSSHTESFLPHRTLALFGDEDGFTSARKLRAWADRLDREMHGRFEYCEVQGAGHFWGEKGVGRRLRERVRMWVEGGSRGVGFA